MLTFSVSGKKVAWVIGHGRPDRGRREGEEVVGQVGGGDVC